ncbi:MFS transporter [Streptomyces sp. NPDC048644]|uniref:MFS transporter n=1 Tax=Streptomyces sp. NPDC048644 TaxID=3365582 RepID=UPI003721356B
MTDGNTGARMPHRLGVILLAFGAFAVGTDGYVISGILPSIAADLHVSEGLTGQLVTVFALSYAVSAPVMMTLTANLERWVVLQASLGVFLVANLLGALAPGYGVLMVARVLAGVGAAVYMNSAVAVATSVAGDRHQGRAVSLVVGGLTVATAFGVPIGSLVGALGSWRLTLVLITVLAALSMGGLALALPATPRPPAITMASRLRVAAQPAVLVAVFINMCAVAGSFVVYTYLAVLTHRVTPLSEAGVSAVLLVWGVAAAVGSTLGGRLSDRHSPDRTFLSGLTGVLVAFAAMGLVAAAAPFGAVPTTAAFLLATLVWSALYWLIPGAQIQRVMGRAPDAPTIAVSISSASSYLGVALGGAVGGLTLTASSSAALPWVGGALVGCALLITVWDRRATAPPPAAQPVGALDGSES